MNNQQPRQSCTLQACTSYPVYTISECRIWTSSFNTRLSTANRPTVFPIRSVDLDVGLFLDVTREMTMGDYCSDSRLVQIDPEELLKFLLPGSLLRVSEGATRDWNQPNTNRRECCKWRWNKWALDHLLHVLCLRVSGSIVFFWTSRLFGERNRTRPIWHISVFVSWLQFQVTASSMNHPRIVRHAINMGVAMARTKAFRVLILFDLIDKTTWDPGHQTLMHQLRLYSVVLLEGLSKHLHSHGMDSFLFYICYALLCILLHQPKEQTKNTSYLR